MSSDVGDLERWLAGASLSDDDVLQIAAQAHRFNPWSSVASTALELGATTRNNTRTELGAHLANAYVEWLRCACKGPGCVISRSRLILAGQTSPPCAKPRS